MPRRAVFLDRDGTLNIKPPEHDYVRDADDFVWLPGAVEAIRRLSRAGYLVAVVSNQRGVARGLVTEGALRRVERRMLEDVLSRGGRIDAFRYCLHDVGHACACRKPRPGMLLDLANELHIDLARSWMVGDSDDDVAAGQAAGCRTVLVGSTRGGSSPNLVARDLFDASSIIVT